MFVIFIFIKMNSNVTFIFYQRVEAKLKMKYVRTLIRTLNIKLFNNIVIRIRK